MALTNLATEVAEERRITLRQLRFGLISEASGWLLLAFSYNASRPGNLMWVLFALSLGLIVAGVDALEDGVSFFSKRFRSNKATQLKRQR